jgi:hypothetical protein
MCGTLKLFQEQPKFKGFRMYSKIVTIGIDVTVILFKKVYTERCYRSIFKSQVPVPVR